MFNRSTTNAGRPRTNRSNRKGSVRVTVTLQGAKGNVTRTLTFTDTTVTDVFGAIATLGVRQAAKQ